MRHRRRCDQARTAPRRRSLRHRSADPSRRARIIAGAANNQLAQGQDGAALQAAGILYAPDYVINAGGIISVSHEYQGGATEAQVIADIHGIPTRLTEIFERARRENRPTSAVADEMARERLGRHPLHPEKLVA